MNAFEAEGGRQVVMDTVGWQDLKVDVTQNNVTEVGRAAFQVPMPRCIVGGGAY